MLPKPNMLPKAAGTNERLQQPKSQELRKKKPPDGEELGKHRMRTAEAKNTPKAETKKATYQLGLQRMRLPSQEGEKPRSQAKTDVLRIANWAMGQTYITNQIETLDRLHSAFDVQDICQTLAKAQGVLNMLPEMPKPLLKSTHHIRNRLTAIETSCSNTALKSLHEEIPIPKNNS